MGNYTGNNLNNVIDVPSGDLGVANNYNGGGGFDDIFFDSWPTAINVDFSAGTVTDSTGTVDIAVNWEGLGATNHDDTVTGGNGGEIFRPFAGTDFVDGGGGSDLIHYAQDFNHGNFGGINFSFVTGTVIDPSGATDTFINIERVRATQNDDTLQGSSADEEFQPLGGTDIVDGGGGFDMVDFRENFDSYTQYFLDKGEPVPTVQGINLDLEAGTVIDPIGDTDTLIGIEGAQGSQFDDTLTGSSDGNLLIGHAGDDEIDGAGGDDTIWAGDGDDTIYGSAGSDLIGGEDGDDLFQGLASDFNGDTLDGISSGDVLEIVDATSGLTATLAGDVLQIDADGDTVIDATVQLQDAEAGGLTVDTVAGTITFFEAPGGGGGETPATGDGDDFVPADDGSSTIYARAGDDTVLGGAGNDTIFGGEGADSVSGDTGTDVVFGGVGNDTVAGGASSDVIGGGQGNDFVYAGDGDDIAYGGAGSDEVYGGAGLDRIFGGVGDDTIRGGEGADTIWGGAGSDDLYGGSGDDLFRFKENSENDSIFDFNGAEGDRIDLQGQLYEVTQNASGNAIIQMTQNNVLVTIELKGVALSAFDQSWII